ncbi:MAG: family 43 glycosylhydrolase [Oscillospiraceae bacterium]|nr:family 43 glycosylhydrolase [Oscillospiraceae bacterium]
MRKRILSCLSAILIFLFVFSVSAQPNTDKTGKDINNGNPLFTQRFGADPAWVEYDGRLYIYMTNDTPMFDIDGNLTENHYGNIKHINVISSEDLMNWTDHGSIPVAGAGHVARFAGNSWAPSVVYKEIDGKDTFFLYFSNGGMGVGVLRGESPVGPWEDPLGKSLVSHSTPNCGGHLVPWCFDPAVFIDDDGTAYMYFGGGVPEGQSSNPKSARMVQLGDDMISIVGIPEEIDIPYFFEALDMVKHGDTYYLSYCSNWQGRQSATTPGGAQIAYMTADHPMGPFTYGGVILKNPGEMFGILYNNNHHSIINFKNNWYLLYHATLVADAKGLRNGNGGQENYRSTHINALTFRDDGTIAEVRGDKKGVSQLMPLYPYKRIEAETIAWSSRISTIMEDPAQKSSLNLFVNGIKNNDWIAVSQVDFGEEGASSYSANVSGTAGGKIELRLDRLNGPVIGSLTVNAASEWETVTADVTDATGVRDLFMVFIGGDDEELFDFDWWSFSKTAVEIDDTDAELPETPVSSDENKSGGNNGWIIGIITAVVVIIGGVAAFIFIKTKKEKPEVNK